MRWLEQRLSTKFTAGTAAGLLASSLVFLVLFIGLYRGQLERERTDAAGQVARLLQTSLENAMLKRDLDGLRDIVERVGRQEGIQGVMLANPQGLVRLATDPAAVGQTMALDPELTTGPHTRFVQAVDGRALLRSINAVRNQPICEECHGPVERQPINGILYVDFDADRIRAQARATTLLLMGAGAIIVLLNLTGGWWFIRRYVIRPVEHLSAVSLRLAEGDLDARARPESRDELGALGRRFNQMAEGLQAKIREVEYKEQFLQRLVDAIPDGIRVIDQDYRVVLANQTYRSQLGLGEDQPPPALCHAATHARLTPCPETLITCPLAEIGRTGRPLRTVQRHLRADGRPMDVEVYAAPMTVSVQGQARLLVVESIRDLEAEVRFSQEQRLSELGRLAAGVAHEIYNPLGSVRLALHAAERAARAEPPELAEIQEDLALVDHEVEQCIGVTERLLKLSMPPAVQEELVDLGAVVAETLKLLHWEAETRAVQIEFQTEDPPLRVLASDGDLRMVTLNLAQNACHAMPQGGRLTVRCAREQGEIRLAFEDTGVGIEPRDLVRVFEPFFSRRADGVRGTGLGLAITKSIVESHGGRIGIESEPGQGCRVTVRFPDADGDGAT